MGGHQGVRGNTTRAKVPYLLKGIVFGNDGRALSPWHTTKKNGRRYRYYIPQRDAKEHAGASGLPRLPAAELESAVLDQLRAILRVLPAQTPQQIRLIEQLGAAINRKESRGSHQRLDGYEERDDVNFLKHTLSFYNGEGAPTIDYSDVKITKSQPAKRVYGSEGEKQDEAKKNG